MSYQSQKHIRYLRLLLLYWCICGTVLSSCKKNKNNTDRNDWGTITVISEHDWVYRINNVNRDTSAIYIYHRGSFFAPVKKVTVDTLSTQFSKAEKDSIHNLVKSLIIHPAPTHSFCTEFVGSLEMYITYGQYQQSGKYSSVCDWSKLSDTTRKLDAILSRHLKQALQMKSK